jgi:hypothetical protein
VFRHIRAALLRGMLLGIVLFGPTIVGVPLKLGSGVSAMLLGVVLGFLLGALWILSGSSSAGAQKIVLVVVSCFVAVTLLDVVARPFGGSLVSPDVTIDWLPMPLVHRYRPDVRFKETIFGELAEPSNMARYREYRDMRFTTDRFGFRNEGAVNEPLDAIVLGDSYAAGVDTTQESTWSTLLSKQHGLHVYNLAVGGDGPWSEYTNLGLEIDRLPRKRQGTVVLWMLFTGNDLGDPCYPIFRKEQLPWRRGVAGLVSSFRTFRNRSPLGNALARIVENSAPRGDKVVVKNFLDGTRILFSRYYGQQAALSLEAVLDDPNYACIKQTISAMRSFAESKNLTVAIIVAPPKEEVYAWVLRGGRPWSTPSNSSGFALAVQEAAREEQIPFLDLKPFLVEASKRVYRASGHLIYWHDDTHWNAEGNMEVATIAYKFYASLTTGNPLP